MRSKRDLFAVIPLSLAVAVLAVGCVPLTPPDPCPYAVGTPAMDISAVLASPPDFSYDFESGWDAATGSGDLSNATPSAPDWRYAHMQRAPAGQTVADPADAGNQVMQFSWIEGAGAAYDTNTQKKAHLYGDYGATPTEEEVWSFNVYYPSSGMEPDSEGEILIQFHGVPDSLEASREPPIGMHNMNDRITLVWRYDYRRITPAGFNNWDVRESDFGPTPKDQWVNYVFHFRMNPDGCGLLRVWQDGVLKVSEFGIPIGYNDEVGAYLGFGIYKWANTSAVATERRVLFDDVRMWRILYQ